MRQQCGGNGSKIVTAIVLCVLALVWMISSKNSIPINSDGLIQNKIEKSIQKNKIQNDSGNKAIMRNNEMEKDNGGIHKIPNDVTVIARANNTKQGFHNHKPLPAEAGPNIDQELNGEKLSAVDLLAGRSSKEYVEKEMDKLNKEKVAADDPRLVTMIRNNFIKPPSNQPYNLHDINKLDTSLGQAAFVDNRLGFQENGFFVESGAHDGEYLSNTLFLERTRHWTGVLIEPLPRPFKALQQKHRKAYTINACLSIRPYPSMEYLTAEPVLGRIVHKSKFSQSYNKKGEVLVQCFPLHSILLALNQSHVDFLSLDVEGVEKQVLDAIPWNKVDIRMLAVEFDKWPGGKDALCKYMERKGYECSVTLQARGAADVIFRKGYV